MGNDANPANQLQRLRQNSFEDTLPSLTFLHGWPRLAVYEMKASQLELGRAIDNTSTRKYRAFTLQRMFKMNKKYVTVRVCCFLYKEFALQRGLTV